MAFLSEEDREEVGRRLCLLPSPVKLVVFTQDVECSYCRETRELAEEIASVSGGKVTVEAHDFERERGKANELGIDKVPAVAVLAGSGVDHGIRFFGIPSGYEFSTFLQAIEMVSGGDSGLSPATRERLKGLHAPLDLQVFVTPTCPYCPRAVMTAFRLAMESDLVKASMVEATEFPHLSDRYGVSGVPHTVIGDSPQPMIGAYPETAAAEMVLAVSQGMKAS